MNKYRKIDFVNEKSNINLISATTCANESTHTHEFLEIIYIFAGKATECIDDISYDVKKGDMLFVNFNQTHSFVVSQKLSYVNIIITPDFFGNELINSESIFEIFSMSLFEEFGINIFGNNRKVTFFGNEIIEIEMIIENMVKEFKLKEVGYLSILGGYMRVVFSKLLRKMKNNGNTNLNKYIRSITPEIMEYINEHCYDKITLDEIAKRSFYNPSYFSRTFKKYCGKTLSSYIKEKRVSKAVLLLENSTDSIETIMESVGFYDKKLFYKHFKEILGTTPGEYRKTL